MGYLIKKLIRLGFEGFMGLSGYCRYQFSLSPTLQNIEPYSSIIFIVIRDPIFFNSFHDLIDIFSG